MDELSGTTNSQIIDATTSVLALSAGQSPAQAFAMLDTVLLESLGMAMYNAVNRQQSASVLSSAAVTATCAKMLGVPLPMPAPPVVAPEPPPQVNPLDGPGGNPAGATVADVYTQAQKDVGALINLRNDAQSTVSSADSDLQTIAGQIGDVTKHPATAASPAPAPTGSPAPAPSGSPAPAN